MIHEGASEGDCWPGEAAAHKSNQWHEQRCGEWVLHHLQRLTADPTATAGDNVHHQRGGGREGTPPSYQYCLFTNICQCSNQGWNTLNSGLNECESTPPPPIDTALGMWPLCTHRPNNPAWILSAPYRLLSSPPGEARRINSPGMDSPSAPIHSCSPLPCTPPPPLIPPTWLLQLSLPLKRHLYHFGIEPFRSFPALPRIPPPVGEIRSDM